MLFVKAVAGTAWTITLCKPLPLGELTLAVYVPTAIELKCAVPVLSVWTILPAKLTLAPTTARPWLSTTVITTAYRTGVIETVEEGLGLAVGVGVGVEVGVMVVVFVPLPVVVLLGEVVGVGVDVDEGGGEDGGGGVGGSAGGATAVTVTVPLPLLQYRALRQLPTKLIVPTVKGAVVYV